MMDMQEQLTRELRFSITPQEQKQIKELLQSSTKLHDNKFEGLDLQITREVDDSSRKEVSIVGLNGFYNEISFETSFSINSETSLTKDNASVAGLVFPRTSESKFNNKEVKNGN